MSEIFYVDSQAPNLTYRLWASIQHLSATTCSTHILYNIPVPGFWWCSDNTDKWNVAVNAGIAKPPLAPCATSPKDVQPSAGPPASHHIAHVFDLNDASHTSHHQYVTNPTVHTWSATHLSNASESNRWNKQWANNAQHQDPRHPLQNSQVCNRQFPMPFLFGMRFCLHHEAWTYNPTAILFERNATANNEIKSVLFCVWYVPAQSFWILKTLKEDPQCIYWELLPTRTTSGIHLLQLAWNINPVGLLSKVLGPYTCLIKPSWRLLVNTDLWHEMHFGEFPVQPTVDQGENLGTVANHKWERTRGELQAVRHAAEATLTQLMEEEPHHSHKHVSAAEFESLRDHRSAQFTGRDLRNLAAGRAHTHHR